MARWCIGKYSSCCLQGGVVAGVVGSNPDGGVFIDIFTLVLKHLHWCIPVCITGYEMCKGSKPNTKVINVALPYHIKIVIIDYAN